MAKPPKYRPQERIPFEQYKDDSEAKAAMVELRNALGLNAQYRVLEGVDQIDAQSHAMYAGIEPGGEYGIPIPDKVLVALLKAAKTGIPVHNFEGPQEVGRQTPLELAKEAGKRNSPYKDVYKRIIKDLEEIDKVYNSPTIKGDPLKELAAALEKMLEPTHPPAPTPPSKSYREQHPQKKSSKTPPPDSQATHRIRKQKPRER